MYPKNFYSWLQVVYKIAGVHRPSEEKGFWKIFYYIYNTSMIITLSLSTILENIAFKNLPKKLDVLVEHLGMIILHLVSNIKIIAIALQYKKLKYVMELLDSEDFRYEEYKDFQPGKIIAKSYSSIRTIFVSFMILAHLVPMSKDGVFVMNLIKYQHLINGINVTCEEILPFYNWVPFEIDNLINCSLAGAIPSLFGLVYVHTIGVHDLTFVYLTIYVRGHLNVLKEAFETMRKRCLYRIDLPPNYEIFRDSDNPKLEKEIQMEYRKLTVHLKTVISVSSDMEQIFQYSLLAQALCTLFVLVSCLYMLSIVSIFSPIAVGQLQFIFSLLYQISFFCFLGNEVTVLTEEVSNGIYFADWYSCTEEIKKSMLLNMIRLEKPIYFTMGKFSPLTLTTLVQILKASYSYFTFLSKSGNGKNKYLE